MEYSRSGHGVALVADTAYIFGGFNGRYLSESEALCETTWSRVTPLPQATHCVTTAVLGD
jgi:hypothetical protein